MNAAPPEGDSSARAEPSLSLDELEYVNGGGGGANPPLNAQEAFLRARSIFADSEAFLGVVVGRAQDAWVGSGYSPAVAAPIATALDYAARLREQAGRELECAADTLRAILHAQGSAPSPPACPPPRQGLAVDVTLMRQESPGAPTQQGGDQGADPLLLDVVGTGVKLTNIDAGVEFDLNGDGRIERVSWTAAQGEDGVDTNAWLVRDDRFDGGADGIQSGRELFGDQHGDVNGFERLRSFDDNADGVFDSRDKAYDQLALWQDRNHDGISQPDELATLASKNVEKIDLSYASTFETDEHGNRIQQGSFTERAHGA